MSARAAGLRTWSRLVASVFVVFAASTARAQSCFEDQPAVALGHYATSMAAADLDGDGRMDLVVTHPDANSVSVLLNQGAGAFAERFEFATGTEPESVAVADFDGDGLPDVVTADFHSNTLSVLMNRGQGRLAARVEYPIATGPYFVTAADLNGDGRPDLVAVDYYAFAVSVLLNVGGGTFGRETVYLVGPNPTSVTCADVDGDGDTDLVVDNYGWHNGTGSITVLLNKGTGLFTVQPEIVLDHPYSMLSIVSGDLDGDSHVDLAIPILNEDKVLLLFNRGDGRFERPVERDVSFEPVTAWIADVDADGRSDVVTLGDSGGISVLGNLGGREFAPFVYSGTRGIRTGALAEFDGDRRPDLAVVNYDTFSIQRNLGDRRFAEAGQVPAGGSPSCVTSADLDGDGAPDLISTLQDSNSVSVLRNLGNGTFAPPVTYPVGAYPQSVASADLDGDGRPDLAVANAESDTVSILFNRGDGTLRPHVDLATGGFPTTVVCADLDGDGRPDLAVGNRTSGSVSVFINRGGGRFSPPADYVPFPLGIGQIVAADFDQDGDVDLAVAGTVLVAILWNRGDGTFGTRTIYDFPNWGFLAAGDLDGDGYPDLALTQFGIDNVTVYLNRGDGTFGTHQPYYTPWRSRELCLADLDGDGRLDVVLVNSDTGYEGALTVLHNAGGSFVSEGRYDVLWGASWVASTDVDADGDADLVVANAAESSLSILRNCRSPSAVFCAGDGAGTACPCGNSSAPGSGAGCLDSRGVAASLRASGSARLAEDGLVLAGVGLPEGIALFLQGTSRENDGSGSVYGDGLRCVGGSIRPIGAVASARGSCSYPRSGDPPVSHRGLVHAPGTRTYQILYRDRARFCTQAEFNLTNGIEIVWAP